MSKMNPRRTAVYISRWLERSVKGIAFNGDHTNVSLSNLPQDSRNGSATGNYILAFMALLIIFYAVLWAFFAQLYTNVDDVSLFNPIYMYVHTGKVTIPTYLYFHSMVVHPPTQYLLMGWLIKAGVPLQYVGSVLPFLLILLIVMLIIFSRFAPETKLALLFSFLAGALFFVWRSGPSSFGLRPDLHMAFALFAGLIGLESGRLQSWDPFRLGLGAFLLTYASGLHYPASLAWMGVLVYLAWLLWQRHWQKQERSPSEGLRSIFALLLGGCAFGIPYLLFFVIPDWHDIVSQVTALDATGGIHASLAEHIKVYQLQYSLLPHRQFTRVLYFPLAMGLPTVLISTTIFLSIKQLRGIALASLPYLLFLLLFVQRKIDYRYILLELMLYVCSLSVLFAVVCRAALANFWPQGRWLLTPFLGVVFGGTLILGLTQEGAREIPLKPRQDTMTIARAAGRRMLGPHALVGNRLGRFYLDGGDLSYMVEPDLLYGDGANFDLKEYFGKFDAIAEDHHWSHATSNRRKESLTSWYARRLLNVRGFFFSHVGIEYLLLATHAPAQIEGYGVDYDGRISHFSEQPGGQWVYVAAVCDANKMDSLALDTIFRSSYLLPLSDSVQKQLEWFVIAGEEYKRVRSNIIGQCAIRDEVAMAMDVQNANQLLLTLRDDSAISFYRYLDQALTVRYGPEAIIATGADGWPVELHFLRGQYQGKKMSLIGESARTIFHPDMTAKEGWSAFTYGKRGRVSLLTVDSQGRKFEFYSDDPRDHLATQYLEVSPQTAQVFFSIWAKPEQSEDTLTLSIQDEQYDFLAHANPIMKRPDGWSLFAGWFNAPKGKIRAVIQLHAGTKFLLDKALIVCISAASKDRTAKVSWLDATHFKSMR